MHHIYPIKDELTPTSPLCFIMAKRSQKLLRSTHTLRACRGRSNPNRKGDVSSRAEFSGLSRSSFSLQPSFLELLRPGGDAWWGWSTPGPSHTGVVFPVSKFFSSRLMENTGNLQSLHPVLQEDLLSPGFGSDWSHQLVELRGLQGNTSQRSKVRRSDYLCQILYFSLIQLEKTSQNAGFALWFWAGGLVPQGSWAV